MKKNCTFFKLCLPLLLFLAAINARAQFSFSPSTLLEKYQAFNSLSYDSIHIVNLSADTLHLNWTLISSDSTAGTYFDYCASGECYHNFPQTGSFPAIIPFGYGWAGAHFWTGSINVTVIAQIWVYKAGDFANGDTLTYILHAGHESGIESTTSSDNILKIYPNPANTTLYVDGNIQGTSTEVYNINGLMILTKTLNSNQLDISRLPTGSYFIKFNTSRGIVVRKFVKE